MKFLRTLLPAAALAFAICLPAAAQAEDNPTGNGPANTIVTDGKVEEGRDPEPRHPQIVFLHVDDAGLALGILAEVPERPPQVVGRVLGIQRDHGLLTLAEGSGLDIELVTEWRLRVTSYRRQE